MLAFFWVFFFARSSIPDHLKQLANKAIENSKIKVDLKDRVDSAYPGDYSFPNAEFTLKRTLSSPNTKDIKGFAIEDEKVAIVKRKNFNLQDNFVFVDPTTQQFYDMEYLLGSDEKVNIYSTKKLTLFDIMTNFNYHSKTDKSITPTIELNWDSTRDGPELKQIPHIAGFDYGLGARGAFTIETYFRFKSASDINLGASIKIDIKAAAELQFHDGTSSGSGNFVLFELPSIPIKQLGFNIKFLGIQLAIQPYIKCDALIKDIRFAVPMDVGILKGYNIVGFKRIDITPNSIVDSKWYINVQNIPEKNDINDIIEQLKQAQIKFTPALRLYLSIEINLGGIQSNFDCGLQIPFEFTFQFEPEKCSFPYLYGDLEIKFQMFYYFGGITINVGKKSLTLIDDSTNSLDIKSIKIEKFCIGQPTKIYEGNPLYIQTSYEKVYYFHHRDVHWYNKRSYSVQIVVNAFDLTDNSLIAKSIHPFVQYTSIPKPCYSDFIIRANGKVQLYYILYYYENSVLKKSDQTGTFEYDNESTYKSEWYPIILSDHNSLILYLDFCCCKEVQYNKVFSKEADSVVVVQLPCYKYNSFVLLSTNKDGGSQIDNNATFYIETLSTNAYSKPGIIYTTSDHYEIKFYRAICTVPMLLDIAVSLKKTENGVLNTYDFGGFSQEIPERTNYLFKIGNYTNQNLRFYAPKDENPELTISCKFVFYHSNGKQEEIPMTRTFNYDTLKSCADKEATEEEFNQNNGRFILRIERINEPLASVNSSLVSDNNMIIRCHDAIIDRIQKIYDIKLDEDEVYFAIRFKSGLISIKNSCIVFRCHNLTPLGENVIIITSNTCLIKGNDSDEITCAFRRTDNKALDTFFVCFISDVNDYDNINIKKEGEIVELKPSERKGFLIYKYYQSTYYFMIDQNGVTPTSVHLEGFRVDSITTFISIVSDSPTEINTIIYCESYDVIEDGQYMISSYIGHLQNIIKKYNAKSFNFAVFTTSDSIKAIRCGDVVKNIDFEKKAVFTFDLDFNDTVDFYAVCINDTIDMCEITQNVTEGEYQLVRFPNRDGLNITGRGMKTAFIHTPNATSFSYYKTFKGSIEILHSYNESINIKVYVKDVENPIQNDEPEVENPSDFDENVTNSSIYLLEKGISYTGPYREFCIKDADNGMNVPFSLKYYSENISEFMMSIDAIDDFDVTHYGISENDCIFVYKEALKSNLLNDLPPEIVDLEVNDDNVQFDTTEMTFNFNKKKKVNVVAIVVPIVVVVILIGVGVFLFIYFRNKKKNISEKENDVDGNETSTL